MSQEKLYAETSGTVTAEDGTEIGIKVQHVSIDPEIAKAVFAEGREVGDWGWKHKIWTGIEYHRVEIVQAAARFYYGWDETSERVTFDRKTSTFTYEAVYAC